MQITNNTPIPRHVPVTDGTTVTTVLVMPYTSVTIDEGLTEVVASAPVRVEPTPVVAAPRDKKAT